MTFQVPILVGSRIFWKGFVIDDEDEEAMMAGGDVPSYSLFCGCVVRSIQAIM